jgi:hypothetical protein
MLQSAEDAPRILADGASLFGPGWKALDSFDDIDEDEYETDEEVPSSPLFVNIAHLIQELYVVMDLGTAVEPKALQSDTSYQLIVC